MPQKCGSLLVTVYLFSDLMTGIKLVSFVDQQTSDILYYEVLDIPLPELQGLKTLKVAFHHATKDEVSVVDCN